MRDISVIQRPSDPPFVCDVDTPHWLGLKQADDDCPHWMSTLHAQKELDRTTNASVEESLLVADIGGPDLNEVGIQQ